MSDLALFVKEKRKKTGRRNDKIASQIRECFSLALSKGDFPILLNHENESKLPTLVTITYIDLSPDLRNAVIFFTPLCGMKKEETKRFFELQVHYFKNAIAKRMNLRFVPNLSFKLDESFDYSAKIEKLLKEKCQKDSNTF